MAECHCEWVEACLVAVKQVAMKSTRISYVLAASFHTFIVESLDVIGLIVS